MHEYEDWKNGGFGLYLHWPFCESKCPYCDFNSHVAKEIDQNQWKRAFLAEIDRIGLETQDKVLGSIYFGGGTPSLMNPDLVAAILDKAKSTWRLENDVEITLEANPTSIEAGRFNGYRDAGVNRISMGMQAMNDDDLRNLGRRHTAAEAVKAFDIARNIFERVSFDLIYARQGQDLASWKRELKRALDLAIDHLSLYQLTIEEGTVFSERLSAGGLRGLPDESIAADMYEMTQEVCNDRGFPAYEVSNHARPGAQSKHNLVYWRGGDYAGIGPGAHGRLTWNQNRFATESPKSPTQWLNMALSGGPAEFDRVSLSDEDRGMEYLLMSLRLSEGLEISRHSRLSKRALEHHTVLDLVELGMIKISGDRLKATAKGRLILNALISKLAGA